MKTSKVKGFTLIELIVVMAIFGIIMFGALQLIVPVTKMMVQADVYEGGNAAVGSITSYLENQLSTAEYLTAGNELLAITVEDDGTARLTDTSIVDEFVKDYYEGALKAGSTIDSQVYGNGKVHVMVIDNTTNGRISEFVYDVKFDINNPDIKLNSSSLYAVNKAYYDTYSFDIRSGLCDDDTFTVEDSETYEGLINNLSSQETVFTIRATTERNKTPYSFLSNATMSLINIFERKGLGVQNVYFVINEPYDIEAGKIEKEIVDISSPNLSRYVPDNSTLSRNNGGVTRGLKVNYVDGSTDGYYFIYSYGSEICVCPDGTCPHKK